MLCNFQKIIGLSVVTQSGQKLGTLKDVVFSLETGVISYYLVRNSELIKQITNSDIQIVREQVLDISQERMLVEDLIISQAESLSSDPIVV